MPPCRNTVPQVRDVHIAGDGDGACAHHWQSVAFDKERRETIRACTRRPCGVREVVRWDPLRLPGVVELRFTASDSLWLKESETKH